MKVSRLIRELQSLKRRHGDLEVYTSAHDNSEFETAGETSSVVHLDISDDDGCGDMNLRPPESEWLTIIG